VSEAYFDDGSVRLFVGDARAVLASLPSESVQCCVTSPPYWGLRDYGVAGQIGLEATPEAYVEAMVGVFREVRRVLREDGTLWLNLGDSYCADVRKGRAHMGVGKNDAHNVWFNRQPDSLKPKDLVGIPWRVAFALQADGWWLRSDIIWSKPNPMPESVTDRPTKAHEYVYLLSKSATYFYDAEAIAEESTSDTSDGRRGDGGSYRFKPTAPATHFGANGTRNRRSVWTITTKPYPEAHFATFPPELPEICIKAGSPPDGVVLDPFAGAGTTLWMAKELGRKAVGIELNPDYARLIEKRCAQGVLAL
jgi:DNA modification methylase